MGDDKRVWQPAGTTIHVGRADTGCANQTVYCALGACVRGGLYYMFAPTTNTENLVLFL